MSLVICYCACCCPYTSRDTNKIARVLGHLCGVATLLYVYKVNSEKYKGKYAIG
jgi:hypothetical protein